jgi:hypothetical protein
VSIGAKKYNWSLREFDAMNFHARPDGYGD